MIKPIQEVVEYIMGMVAPKTQLSLWEELADVASSDGKHRSLSKINSEAMPQILAHIEQCLTGVFGEGFECSTNKVGQVSYTLPLDTLGGKSMVVRVDPRSWLLDVYFSAGPLSLVPRAHASGIFTLRWQEEGEVSVIPLSGTLAIPLREGLVAVAGEYLTSLKTY